MDERNYQRERSKLPTAPVPSPSERNGNALAEVRRQLGWGLLPKPAILPR